QQGITELSSLLKLGMRQLEDSFREILSEDMRTLEPLHYITKRTSRIVGSHTSHSSSRNPVPRDSAGEGLPPPGHPRERGGGRGANVADRCSRYADGACVCRHARRIHCVLVEESGGGVGLDGTQNSSERPLPSRN